MRLPKFLHRRHLSGATPATVANGCAQLRTLPDVPPATCPQATQRRMPQLDLTGLTGGGHIGGSFERRARRTRWTCDGHGRYSVARPQHPTFATPDRKAA